MPEHVLVAQFDSEEPSPPDFDDFGFGEAVAIRNELAFIGIPRSRENGQVLVLILTATGWQGVQTLTAPNP